MTNFISLGAIHTDSIHKNPPVSSGRVTSAIMIEIHAKEVPSVQSIPLFFAKIMGFNPHGQAKSTDAIIVV